MATRNECTVALILVTNITSVHFCWCLYVWKFIIKHTGICNYISNFKYSFGNSNPTSMSFLKDTKMSWSLLFFLASPLTFKIWSISRILYKHTWTTQNIWKTWQPMRCDDTNHSCMAMTHFCESRCTNTLVWPRLNCSSCSCIFSASSFKLSSRLCWNK